MIRSCHRKGCSIWWKCRRRGLCSHLASVGAPSGRAPLAELPADARAHAGWGLASWEVLPKRGFGEDHLPFPLQPSAKTKCLLSPAFEFDVPSFPYFCQITSGGFAFWRLGLFENEMFWFLLLGFRHCFPQLKTQLTFSFWQIHNVTCKKEICISFMLGMWMRSSLLEILFRLIKSLNWVCWALSEITGWRGDQKYPPDLSTIPCQQIS